MANVTSELNTNIFMYNLKFAMKLAHEIQHCGVM